MEQITILWTQISIFAVMLAVGFLARKIKLADKSVFDAMTVFTVKVLLPLFMLTTLPGLGSAADAGKVFLLFGVFAVFYEGDMAVSNMAVTTTTCAGFIGLPIASAMYGAYGTLVMALYSAFDNFTTWTHKAYVLNQCAKGQNVLWWKKMVNPQIICVLWDSLYQVGEMAKYMGMLFLGSTLADLNKTFLDYLKPILYTVLVRMVLFPLLFGLAAKQMGLFDAQDLILLTIILATPPMASMPTIIKSFGIEERYAAQCLIFTTLISLATMPAVLWVIL